MSPKKVKQQPAPRSLVSASDLAAAEAVLQNDAQMKKARSNMTYWLRLHGYDQDYFAKNATAKREYLAMWQADKMSSGNRTRVEEKTVTSESSSGRKFVYMAKQQLINEYGEAKALAKIRSGALEHQPDPDSGLDDEWNREYKIWTTGGKEIDSDVTTNKLRAEHELTDESTKEAAEQLQEQASSMVHCQGGSTASGASSGAATGSGGGVAGTPIKIEPSAEVNPHKVTYDKFKSDLKKEMRVVAEYVVTLKEIFSATKDGRYVVELHHDSAKLIPKISSTYKKMEAFHLDASTDDATLLQHDNQKNECDEIIDWYQKIVPKVHAKRAKKA